MVTKRAQIIIRKDYEVPDIVLEKAKEFLKLFKPSESVTGIPLNIYFDKKSEAYYIICHLKGSTIVSKTDLDAVLDPEESEDYKLNRNLYLNTFAYNRMENDAKGGRSFEDIVIEYDTSYRSEVPLKVFGGQHRVKAIEAALKKKVNEKHGLRVYFDLTTEQKFDIATANNTSIAVSNDLLDRMQEDLLGAELRNWCQRVGLLREGSHFADRRSAEGIPTVRIARTIVVNYFIGRGVKEDILHTPVVCKSGPEVDKKYIEIRGNIDWEDARLVLMGKEFADLHKLQRERVLNRDKDSYLEFANKAVHPSIAASWAYAAGYFERERDSQKAHYGLRNAVEAPGDPLNAGALLKARLKGADPDTYRGLGSRISAEEIRRMLEVFSLQATKASKRGINLKLANAAIQTYHAKKAKFDAEKAVEKI